MGLGLDAIPLDRLVISRRRISLNHDGPGHLRQFLKRLAHNCVRSGLCVIRQNSDHQVGVGDPVDLFSRGVRNRFDAQAVTFPNCSAKVAATAITKEYL